MRYVCVLMFFALFCSVAESRVRMKAGDWFPEEAKLSPLIITSPDMIRIAEPVIVCEPSCGRVVLFPSAMSKLPAHVSFDLSWSYDDNVAWRGGTASWRCLVCGLSGVIGLPQDTQWDKLLPEVLSYVFHTTSGRTTCKGLILELKRK